MLSACFFVSILISPSWISVLFSLYVTWVFMPIMCGACVQSSGVLSCVALFTLSPVRLIKVLEARRRAHSKYHFPHLSLNTQPRKSHPKRGSYLPLGLDFRRPLVGITFEISSLACQILRFSLTLRCVSLCLTHHEVIFFSRNLVKKLT